MDKFVRGITLLSQICGVVAAALIAASVVIVCQMVFVRYVLNQTTIWQTDFVTFSIVAATFIGSPYLLLNRGQQVPSVVEHHPQTAVAIRDIARPRRQEVQVDLDGGANSWVTLSSINATGAVTLRYLSGGAATSDGASARAAALQRPTASPEPVNLSAGARQAGAGS